MKKHIIFFLSAVLFNSVNAQVVFDKYYPYFDWGYAEKVFIQEDGYQLLAVGNLSEDVYLFKTDVLGDTIWTKKYDLGSNFQSYFTFDQDSSGNIYVGVSHHSTSEITKLSPEGDIIWSRELPEEQFALKITKDDNLLVETHKEFKSFLYKFDSNGDSLWKIKTMELDYSIETPVLLTEMEDGNIVSTHYWIAEYKIPYESRNVIVSPQGDVLSTYTFNFNGHGFIITDQIFSNNELIAVGYSNINNKPNFVVAYDSDGTISWYKRLSAKNVTNIISNRNNEIVIAGSSSSVYQINLQCFTSAGDSLWAREHAYASAEIKDLKETPDGGYILAVNFYEFGAMPMMSLVKTDSLGRMSTLGIHELPGRSGIVVYPNPASTEVTLTVTDSAPGTITFIDLAGRVCKNITLTDTKSTIQIRDLNSGVYLYKYQTSHSVTTGKLIVSH